MHREKFVKNLGFLAIVLSVGWSVIGLSVVATAGPREEAVSERLQKAGSVCVEGEACAKNGASSGMASVGGSDAQENYKKTCSTCHNIGVAGAPKFGDVAQWQPRIAKGLDVLYASSINGLPPGMPAKGMCFSCSDDDLKAIVDYMVDASK